MTLEKIINANMYCYGNYSNSNYGTNSTAIKIGSNTYYFSYSTLIAFKIKEEFHISQNYWGTTTGKHLNWINPDKSIRETQEEFINNFNRLMEE